MDFRVIVFPVHARLWKIVDSAHPQVSVEYADRRTRSIALAVWRPSIPSIVEVLTDSRRVSLRERCAQLPESSETE